MQVFALLFLVALASCQHHQSGKWVRQVTTGPYFPRGRFFHAQATVGDVAIVFGGTNGNLLFNDLFTLSIEQSSTHLLDNGSGPSAREGMCAAFLPQIIDQEDSDDNATVVRNATFVIWGGYDGSYLNELWTFDLAQSTWTQVKTQNGPSGRAYHTCTINGALGNETLQVFGGYDGTNYYGADDFWNFDSTTGNWNQLPNNAPSGVGPSPRAFIQGVEQGGSLYFYGGFDGTNCFGDTWAYKYETGAWFNIPTVHSPPVSAGYAGIHMFGGGYDVFGGWEACAGSGNDLYSLSHNSYDWQLVPPNGIAPPPRAGAAATRHGHDVLLYGGADGTISSGSFVPSQVYDDLWYYVA